MKMVTHIRVWLFTAMVVILVGCSKDGSTGQSNAQLIGNGKAWKFSKATAGGIDVSAFIEVCIKDNLITMVDATKTGEMNEGATKCDASDPQSVNFTWTYDASFKKLVITSAGSIPILPGGSNEFTVVSVSESRLVLSQNVTFSGSIQLVEVTLVH